MAAPTEILDLAFQRAMVSLAEPIISDPAIIERVEYVARNKRNRAGIRLLISCLLAKVHKPDVDLRKPYTEIGDSDAFSGRSYDERFISSFVTQHDLPCNTTTAFLTPALRNRAIVLTPDVNLVGSPPEVYQNVLQLFADVHQGRVSAGDLLAESIRSLLVYRNERRQRMDVLLEGLNELGEGLPLSSEGIVTLIQQHLASPGSSRLPVLVVAAAYKAAEERLGERVLPLHSHTAADKQTGALGDLEISLIDDDGTVTSYEMKAKRVTATDIDIALQKLVERQYDIDNYIFITTELIDRDVADYASSIYEKSGGIEMVILDCLQFLRHFLHLFHRLRLQFLNEYQELLLAEPDSAVRQELKAAFLALRQAAESANE